MDYIGKSPVPVAVLIAGKAAFLGCWMFLAAGWMRPELMLYDSAAARAAGAILFAAGLAMVIVSLAQLGRSAAVGLPARKTELKTDGLFRLTRNPIYLGAFIMCAGSCLAAAHPVNVLLFGIAAAVHTGIVRREEKFLEQRFGQRWLDYKQRVPRFIGMRGQTKAGAL